MPTGEGGQEEECDECQDDGNDAARGDISMMLKRWGEDDGVRLTLGRGRRQNS